MGDTKREMTYIGRRLATSGKLLHFWMPDGDVDDAGGYRKQLVPAAIGTVYEFTFSDDGSVFTGGEKRPVRVRHLLDDESQREAVELWTVADRHAAIADEDAKRAKNEARENELSKLCEPLRDLMRKQIGSARRASLLAAVIEEITR
jgi:hypothetical protein